MKTKISMLVLALAGASQYVSAGECGPDTMFLRGTNNQWTTTAMTCANGVWEAQAYFSGTDARFKFDRFGDWSENWGDNNSDGVVDYFGGDIYATSGDGYYGIEFDSNTGTYRFAKCDGKRLSHTPSGGLPEQMTAFNCSADGEWFGDIEVAAGQTWDITNANLPEMFTRYGDNEPDGTLDANGSPLSFDLAGEYRLSVNPDAMSYAVEALDCGPEMRYERPSLTGHLQTHSMTCNLETRRWEAEIAPWSSTSPLIQFHIRDANDDNWGDSNSNGFSGALTQSEGFIFDDGRTFTVSVDPVTMDYALYYEDCGPQLEYERPSMTGKLQSHDMTCDTTTGEWYALIEPWSPTSPLIQFHIQDPQDNAWGDSDSNGVAGDLVAGEGFFFSNGQSILIRVDLSNQTYTISDNFTSNFDQVYFRGTPNGWGTTAMTLIADNTWEIVASFSDSNARFKFDVYGDWSENYGDNNSDGIADANGADIFVSTNNAYRIIFNDFDLTYTVELTTP